MPTLVPMNDGLLASIVEALSRSNYYQGLPPAVVRGVAAKGEITTFEEGEDILTAGTSGDDYWFLLRGEAEVLLPLPGGEVHLTTLPVPSLVGEMGILLDAPRSATVRAGTRVVAVRFGGGDFLATMESVPAFALGVARELARRVQAGNARNPLREEEVDPARIDPDVLRLLPEAFLERHALVPLRLEGKALVLGMAGGFDTDRLRLAQQQLPALSVRPVAVSRATFDAVMRSMAGIGSGSGTPDEGAAPPLAGSGSAQPSAPPRPRPGLLDGLLRRMVAEGASDLHMSAGQPCRWRVDGHMHEIRDLPALEPDAVLGMLLDSIPDRSREEFERTNDADFAVQLPDRSRFRVNLFRDLNGTGAVFRHIPGSVMSPEQLGLPPSVLAMSELPKGLVLVTGPTGSGKSSTLAALIDRINGSRRSHVITLEDPVEFVHRSRSAMINQREVGTHTSSFARAMRAALREDPDVILVGEMRDRETVHLALEAAATGHLVFATLHTPDAVGTIGRVVELFPGEMQDGIRGQLAENLRGVVAQTLCRRSRGGRVAAFEVLVVTRGVANLIREGKATQIPNLMQAGKAHGMILMNASLKGLVDRKEIEFEEAWNHSLDRNELARLCNRPPLSVEG